MNHDVAKFVPETDYVVKVIDRHVEKAKHNLKGDPRSGDGIEYYAADIEFVMNAACRMNDCKYCQPRDYRRNYLLRTVQR